MNLAELNSHIAGKVIECLPATIYLLERFWAEDHQTESGAVIVELFTSKEEGLEKAREEAAEYTEEYKESELPMTTVLLFSNFGFAVSEISSKEFAQRTGLDIDRSKHVWNMDLKIREQIKKASNRE